MSENATENGTVTVTEKTTENGTVTMTENGTDSETEAESPLSKEEADAIRETWALMWSDKKKNGIELFVRFFIQYPAAQDMFKDFKGMPIEEVRVHKKLRAHALSVMYGLKSFIDNLDDVETLVELVRKNQRNHAERGIGEQEVKWLIPPLVEILEELMAGKLTELHKTAWTKLFGVVGSIAKEETDKLKQSKISN